MDAIKITILGVYFLLATQTWARDFKNIYPNFLPQSSSNARLANSEVVHHQYFSLSYNEDHELANWVIYDLNHEKLAKNTKRKNNFKSDPLVSTYSASPEAYRGSGYDRGHMVPAGSMRFSREAMKECFYMSNMAPQRPGLNRGVWVVLENQIRRWAKKDQLVIAMGPVLQPGLKKLKENVSVPKFFYKIIYKNGAMIGFLFENKKSNQKFMEHAVAVDYIESLTGLDFFSQLPDQLEERLESKINLKKWL